MVKFGKTYGDLAATSREFSWRSIRSLRASPPGHVTEPRRATFAMALEQAEQLFNAAAGIEPAARPLALFYSLSQAGRALVSTLTAGDPWTFRGHGIRETSGVNGPASTVGDFQIEPHESHSGALAMVATALDSSTLPGPTRLGDLWPLLPETYRFQLPNAGEHRLLNVQVRDDRAPLGPIGGQVSNLPANLGVQRRPDEDPKCSAQRLGR